MTTSEDGARRDVSAPARRRFGDRYVIAADRVFDGTRVLEGHAVAVSDDKITAVAPAGRLRGPGEHIRFVGTLDTLSHGAGVAANAAKLGEAGVTVLYGTDLAHPDVPWGINAHELMLMAHTAYRARTPLDVLSAATARAGEHLGLAPLGQLIEGAPDLIGLRGDPIGQFKPLEYPDLVIAGGVAVTAPAGD